MKYPRRRRQPVEPMALIALKVVAWFVGASLVFWGLAHLLQFIATH